MLRSGQNQVSSILMFGPLLPMRRCGRLHRFAHSPGWRGWRDHDGLRLSLTRCSGLRVRYTVFRTQMSRVKKAIQKAPAIEATTIKFTGETSHDVSATMRPKAKQ